MKAAANGGSLKRAFTANLRKQHQTDLAAPHGFTLIEVMIAIGVLGIVLITLLTLHRQSIRNVTRSRQLTRAAMLAQELMTKAELERFPKLGVTKGDFAELNPGHFQNYRWERRVNPSPIFPELREVEVRVFFGPGQRSSFSLVEVLRRPSPGVIR